MEAQGGMKKGPQTEVKYVQKVCTSGYHIWCDCNEVRHIGVNKFLKGLEYHDKVFEHYPEGRGNQ